MKIWLFAVVLAFAVAAAAATSEVAADKYLAKDKTEVDVAVTDVPEAEADAEAKVETEGEAEEESETEAGEKEEGGSNESSSEENEEGEEKEKEEEESSTNKADEEVTTVKVVGYVPVVYTTEAYIKPAYVPTAATYSKSNYIQIPGPVYKPVVTTEAPKPAVTYNVVKSEISAPAVVQTVETPKTESKYVKPVITAVLETTTKYSPIVFEKPSSAPVVTVRKSGWVRAPGYNLGYARSENSGPAVVETAKTSVTRNEPVATSQTVVTPLAYRQWFYKPQ